MNLVVRSVSIDPEASSGDFRNAMRQLTGGVSVITAGTGRDISGMTVTSVSSLSVDPPALIVSINREASSWPLVRRYGFFGVNILTSDQIDIAERFTGRGGLKGADRFAGARWMTRASGVPLLVGALAAIDCEVEDIVERHSHAIVIGRVLDVAVSARTAALAYWQGRYVAIDQDEDAAKLAEVSLPAPHVSRNSSEVARSCRAGFFAVTDLNPANEANCGLGILRRRRDRDRLSRAVRLCGFHRTRPAARRSHPHLSQAGCTELLRHFNLIASVATCPP